MPECGTKWKFIKKPVYFLTGCSGVGKTTTGKELIKITTEYVILDADMFYNLMPHETEQDYYAQVEQILSLSKNISQSGKSVLWTMAGNIDKLLNTYHAKFFSEIKVLALTCSEESLRIRMTEGRGITDKGWIKSSVEYNEYFKTHKKIGEIAFEVLDITNQAPKQVAMSVLEWMNSNKFCDSCSR